MLRLHSRVRIRGTPRRDVLKVVTVDEFISGKLPPERCALWYDGSEALAQSRALEDLEWGAIVSARNELVPDRIPSAIVDEFQAPEAIQPGAVILLDAARETLNVLYRRGSRSNSLLVTERCNSYCVMCSQPPVDRNEEGRVRQLIECIELIDSGERELGLTGGEPTLLGESLLELLHACAVHLPETQIHVLTNGRRFADESFAKGAAEANGSVTWAIPLYSESPEIHDYVVQRRGAFAETMAGLMNLARLERSVELRVVLQRDVVPRIRQLAHFIARNLPFADHVAWMGLEPMGFARGNWRALWMEPGEFMPALEDAVKQLDSYGMATSLYNLPLCVLPTSLWRFAAQSISDWKNEYLPQCEGCVMRGQCCGFFGSAKAEHMPKAIKPFTRQEALEVT